MRDKKRIIEEFADLINEEVFRTVEQDISFHLLAKAKRILILQSAPVHIIAELAEKIVEVNGRARFIIFGQEACMKLREYFGTENLEVISHNQPFRDADIEAVKRIAEKYAVDAVVFCNDYVNSVDFTNVEHVTAFLNKVPVFSYSYVQKELNRHKDSLAHIYGCIAYKALVEWFQQNS